MSLAMEKVVVVVVVTMREGSLGSGIRFDCENLREPQIVDGIFGKKCVLHLGQAHAVRRQR